MAWHWDKTVHADGNGDYIGLDEFEAAAQSQDPSGTDGIIARVEGDLDDGATVYWNGWADVFDADTWLVIEGDSGCQPDGVNNASGDDALIDSFQLLYPVADTNLLFWINISIAEVVIILLPFIDLQSNRLL